MDKHYWKKWIHMDAKNVWRTQSTGPILKNIEKKVNRWGTKNSVDPFEMFVGVKHEKLMVESCIFIQIFLFRAVVNMYVNSE